MLDQIRIQYYLDFYFDNKFHLTKIRHNSKIPYFSGFQLPENRITYEQALHWLKEQDGNIAVVCGEQSNGLIDFDFDERPDIKTHLDYYRSFNTMITFSPRGYHISYITKLNRKEAIKKFNSLYPDLETTKDSVRFTGHYFLLPPSKSNNKYYFALDDYRTGIREL